MEINGPLALYPMLWRNMMESLAKNAEVLTKFRVTDDVAFAETLLAAPVYFSADLIETFN